MATASGQILGVPECRVVSILESRLATVPPSERQTHGPQDNGKYALRYYEQVCDYLDF